MGAAQELLEGLITPNRIHLSICLSIISLFTGELGKGGNKMGLEPRINRIYTLESKCHKQLSNPKESWLDLKTCSSWCWLLTGSSGFMSSSSIKWSLLIKSSLFRSSFQKIFSEDIFLKVITGGGLQCHRSLTSNSGCKVRHQYTKFRDRSSD